jgi:hypothetical protein
MCRSGSLAGLALAALWLASCAHPASQPIAANKPVAEGEVWMGDLLRDGFRIRSETVFLQATRFGPKRYRYLLTKGTESWACYRLDSAADPEAITDRSCLPYDPASI